MSQKNQLLPFCAILLITKQRAVLIHTAMSIQPVNYSDTSYQKWCKRENAETDVAIILSSAQPGDLLLS